MRKLFGSLFVTVLGLAVSVAPALASAIGPTP
jgi:hypothetical protein